MPRIKSRIAIIIFLAGVIFFQPFISIKHFFGIQNANAFSYGWTKVTGANLVTDIGDGVVVDHDGNIIQVGYFSGSNVNFNDGISDPHSSNGLTDVFITKVSADGTYGWTKTFGGTDASYGDRASEVAVDSNNNIYLTGYFTGSNVDFDASSGVDNHSANGSYDVFVTKYNEDGSYGWTKTFGGSGTYGDVGYDIAIDSGDNIYVTGFFKGTNVNFDTFGGSDLKSSVSESDDVFLTKYNANGTYGWTFTYGTSSLEKGDSITFESTNYVYISGDQGSQTNAFLRKINASTGAEVWNRVFARGMNRGPGTAITIDSSSNLYITGGFSYSPTDFDGTSGTDNHSSNGSYDIFITSYAGDGSYRWTRTIGNTTGDTGMDITVYKDGNLLISGYFSGTNTDFDGTSGIDNKTSNGSNDAFLTSYTTSGDYEWTLTLGGSSADSFNDIDYDTAGSIYLSGEFRGSNVNFDIFGGSDIRSADTNGAPQIFLTKFSGLGSGSGVDTVVTVDNSSPEFSIDPHEDPASTNGSSPTDPTSIGSSVTFKSTATEPNGETWYLAVCKTNFVTPNNGSAPTCAGGSWCISSGVSSGSEASCTYSVLAGDIENNTWYAFVCDGNATSASCSASSQGSGSSGSPFFVNHRPVFAAISNSGSVNPGNNVTWSTNSSTLDNDSDASSDTVKLIVCKTAGISNDDCDGGASDRWCASSFVASNPGCQYSTSSVTHDETYAAYTYLIDQHYLGATGANQGFNSSFNVNNVAPSVSTVTLNNGSDIDLTSGTTTAISLTATITDNNGCGDISGVAGSLYRSGIGWSGCDTSGEVNDNFCYPLVSCTVVTSGNMCGALPDASADYNCTVNIQYFADPTDALTLYPTEIWKDTISATDDNTANATGEVTTGVEMKSLTAYSVTSFINYGNLAVGGKNDPLDKITNITNTGNVGLDEELSGTDMSSSGNIIAVTEQHYTLSASTAYASGTGLTTSTVQLSNFNCAKPTSTSPVQKGTWWGINIPNSTIPGSYTGTNTIVGLKGDTSGW